MALRAPSAQALRGLTRSHIRIYSPRGLSSRTNYSWLPARISLRPSTLLLRYGTLNLLEEKDAQATRHRVHFEPRRRGLLIKPDAHADFSAATTADGYSGGSN